VDGSIIRGSSLRRAMHPTYGKLLTVREASPRNRLTKDYSK
jgi:hypothetical protein